MHPKLSCHRQCAAALLLAAMPLPVQLAAQQAADPAATLAEATRNARLEVEGTPAFRAEAAYKVFDYRDALVSSGKLTEEFLKPGFRKLTVLEGGGETYAPEDQEKIGDPEPASTGTFMQRLLIDAFLHPGPPPAAMATGTFKQKDQKVGTVSLRCITLTPAPEPNARRKPTPATYCVAPDKPIIRLASAQYGLQVVYNRLGVFAGHTVAQQVTIQQHGLTRATLDVTRLVADPKLQAADFPKPADDTMSPEGNAVRLMSGVQAGQLLSKVPPIYPLEAKQKHISGTVVLHSIIGKDGTIEALEVISAPDESLAEAAMEAVSQWRYKPYLLNGKPCEVDTTVTVNFSFG